MKTIDASIAPPPTVPPVEIVTFFRYISDLYQYALKTLQKNHIPPEVWPDIYGAIEYAVAQHHSEGDTSIMVALTTRSRSLESAIVRGDLIDIGQELYGDPDFFMPKKVNGHIFKVKNMLIIAAAVAELADTSRGFTVAALTNAILAVESVRAKGEKVH
jgi:hypothetical protein